MAQAPRVPLTRPRPVDATTGIMIRPLLLASLAALSLSACNRSAPTTQNDLDQLDRELTQANGDDPARDPALTAALRDQIMVDPALAQSSNGNAVRPPARPDSGAVPAGTRPADPVDPATLRKAPAPSAHCPECRARDGALTAGALAGTQSATAACARNVRYSATYANRLPPTLPLYPGAQVSEAAGADADGCALRVVTFRAGGTPGRVIDWYFTHARQGGYSAEHKAEGPRHVIGGTRGPAAYIVYVSPRPGGGSDVDFITNAGI